MLHAFRAIRLHIEDVQAKLKFGGKKTGEQQAAIAEQLRQRAGLFGDEARAHLLRRRLQTLSDREAEDTPRFQHPGI